MNKLQVEIGDVVPREWSISSTENRIWVKRTPVLSRAARIFTLGSCFAEEIRRELAGIGFQVLPQYHAPYDPHLVYAHRIEANHTNHYHTFSIRQELEKATGKWRQADDDYWEIPDHIWKGEAPIYQDPYRRAIYARTLKDIRAVTRQIDQDIADGLARADAFIITLGLVEVWRKKDNGLMAGAGPGWDFGGGKGKLAFHFATFPDNYSNVLESISIIRGLHPDAPIVLTVSPIAISKTRTDVGCVVANNESKSILRAVAGQIVRDVPNVYYFPSFEIFNYSEAARWMDGRHVIQPVLDLITSSFITAFKAD